MRGFGAMLEAYIGEAGYSSLNSFARDVGSTGTTISSCIRGIRPPPLDHLEKWARALQLTGQAKSDFIRAGWRVKALSQDEARPYLEYIEKTLTEARVVQRELRTRAVRAEARATQLEGELRRRGLPIPPEPPPPADEPG